MEPRIIFFLVAVGALLAWVTPDLLFHYRLYRQASQERSRAFPTATAILVQNLMAFANGLWLVTLTVAGQMNEGLATNQPYQLAVLLMVLAAVVGLFWSIKNTGRMARAGERLRAGRWAVRGAISLVAALVLVPAVAVAVVDPPEPPAVFTYDAERMAETTAVLDTDDGVLTVRVAGQSDGMGAFTVVHGAIYQRGMLACNLPPDNRGAGLNGEPMIFDFEYRRAAGQCGLLPAGDGYEYRHWSIVTDEGGARMIGPVSVPLVVTGE